MFIQYDNFGNTNIARFGMIKTAFNVDIHIHQFIEILVILKGKLDITVSGARKTISGGDVVVISPFEPHGYCSEYCELYVILFPSNIAPSFIQSDVMYSNRSDFFFHASNTLIEYIKEHYLESDNKLYPLNNDTLFSLQSLIYVIFEEYVRKVPVTPKTKAKTDITSSVIFYIKKHFREMITLKSVASALGYNPTYISQCISRIPNMNFNKLLNSIRVEEAKKLLIQTDLRIENVALECGFSGERSFYRVFSQLVGCTPATFRNSK